MKSMRILFLVSVITIVFGGSVFADTAKEEFLKQYDDYWNSVYEKYGYSSYEEYAEDFYNPKKKNNNSEEYNDEEIDEYNSDYETRANSNANKRSKKKSAKTGTSNKQNNSKIGNYNSGSNKSNISSDKISHTFVGKTKEECPELDYLYRNSYYLKPRLDDFCSPSMYYLDDTKTVYYYPIINESNYKSFIVLNSDTLSINDTSGVIYLNICQFLLNEDGTWSSDLILPNTFRDDNEKTKFSDSYNNLILDTALLYNIEDRKPEPEPIHPEWYAHLSEDMTYFMNTTAYGSKFAYAMLTKGSSNKYYVYNRDKVVAEQAEATKKQELSKLGFQYVNQMTELANEFDKSMKEYLNIGASMNVAAVQAYQPRLKSYYDTLSAVAEALSYDSSMTHDVNIVKGMLRDARNIFTFLR